MTMLLGHQIQAEWIADDGSTYQPVTVYFDLLRLWDSRAVWWKMETDTRALDANIRFAQSRNAKVMFTFGEPPESALAPGYKKVPTLEAWEAFVTRMSLVQGIDVYEGVNEPAYPQYWDGTPELLVLYQRRLYEILKPTEKTILSPSFTRVELPDGQAVLKRYIAVGGLNYCDAIAWHGYAAESRDLVGQIAALRSLVGDRPLWNTEHVVGSGLAQMAKALELQASLGVRCAVWNAEIPGSEDYTDPTMQRVHDRLTKKKRGCLPSFLRA